MILQKYLIRQCLGITLFITTVLFIVAFITQLNLQLKSVIAGLLNIELLIPTLLHLSPGYLSIVIPLSFFVSLIITLNLLHNNNELTVIYACGISRNRICLMLLPMVFILFIMTLILNLFIIPYNSRAIDDILAKQDSFNALDTIDAQKFISLDNNITLHTKELLKDKKILLDVYIFDNNQQYRNGTTVIYAKEARLEKQDNQKFIALTDGYQVSVTPGQVDVTKTTFKHMSIRLPRIADVISVGRNTSLNNSELLASTNPEVYQLFFWRISMALLIPIFFVLVIYLFTSRPRSNNLVNFVVFFCIGLGYMGAIAAISSIVSNGHIKAEVGYGLVHSSMLVITWSIHRLRTAKGF